MDILMPVQLRNLWVAELRVAKLWVVELRVAEPESLFGMYDYTYNHYEPINITIIKPIIIVAFIVINNNHLTILIMIITIIIIIITNIIMIITIAIKMIPIIIIIMIIITIPRILLHCSNIMNDTNSNANYSSKI